MGFFDLFKPKWKHSDPTVRADAVRELGEDELSALREVLEHDPDAQVRRVALKKLTDPELLAKVAERDADEGIRRAAAEKAGEIWVARAVGQDEPAALAVLGRLGPRELAETVRRSPHAAVREAALERVSDGKALADVARNAADPRLRRAAVERLSDVAALRDVAAQETLKDVALAALGRLGDDVAALEAVVKRTKMKVVRNAAKERLAALAPPPVAPAGPSPEVIRRARQVQLLGIVEAASTLRDLDTARQRMEEARAGWEELGTESGDERYAERWERAWARYLAYREEMEKAARARAEAEARRAEAEARRGAAAEPRSGRPERTEAAPTQTEPEGAGPEQQPSEGQRARATEKARRLETERENLERFEALCLRLEQAVGLDELKAAERILRETDAACDRLGPIPRESRDTARARYDAARARIGARIKDLNEAEEWKRWANVPQLEALCGKVEALRELEDPKAAMKQLKVLQAEWKEAGPVPREKSQALWARFKQAGDEVHQRCRERFAALDGERAANQQRKEELCARVEALAERFAPATAADEPAAPAAGDWKEAAETIKALQEEWKGTGPAPRDQAEALWQRFRGACDRFFERRKAHFAGLDAERAANLQRQEELCAKAEALAERFASASAPPAPSAWREASDALKALQAEWKGIGPAPRDQAEAVWQRFRGACDRFFERRKAELGKLDEERAANLKSKEELCATVENAEAPEDSVAAGELIRKHMAEWKAIGPAPRDDADAVWERFRKACDGLRARAAVPAANEPPPPEPGASRFENKLPLAAIAERLAAAKDEPR